MRALIELGHILTKGDFIKIRVIESNILLQFFSIWSQGKLHSQLAVMDMGRSCHQ